MPKLFRRIFIALKKNLQKITRHNEKGSSLLIALGLVTILVLVAIGVTTVVVSSIRESTNVNRANQAYYAAEGALESGLLANQSVGAGYTNLNPQDVKYSAPNCNPNNAGQNCQNSPYLHGSYQIQGQVPLNKKYTSLNLYGLPTPGTGTAGVNCDLLTPHITGNFYYPVGSMNSYPAEDDPCNWSKLQIGDIVSIPLYITTSANDPNALNCSPDIDNPGFKVCNPEDLNLSIIKLRMRTPCENGAQLCSDASRYALDSTSGDPQVLGDDTIVSWEITGNNLNNDQTYSLRPIDEILNKIRKATNAEIHESLINKAKALLNASPYCSDKYCVLKETRGGIDLNEKKGSILAFLKNGNGNVAHVFYRTTTDKINKPVLKLSIIHSMKDVNASIIPYLEYQLLLDAPSQLSPTDVNQTITAEGFSGSFKQVLQVKQPQQSGLLEYVIQQ